MTILYQIPGDISAGPLGSGELLRRLGLLRGWAAAGTTVEIADTPGGPFSIESAAEEAMCVAPTLDALARRTSQPDAVIVGCFGDPGLAALRETLDCPVIGPFEASMHLGAQLGNRVGVVTVVDGVIPVLDRLARAMGETLNYAGAVAVNVNVLDLRAHSATLADTIIDAGRALVRERRADVLVLGCMSMAFLGMAEAIGDRCGVPILNPARVALKTAEAMAALGVRQSRRTYPRPAKPLRLGVKEHV
jgi:allantoin racemase